MVKVLQWISVQRSLDMNLYIHTILNSFTQTLLLRFESILVVLVQCSNARKPKAMN